MADDESKILSYAAPAPPESLGRWFRRRFIIFVCIILGYIVTGVALRGFLNMYLFLQNP